MKRIIFVLILLIVASIGNAQTVKKTVLVFSKVSGYFHESIPAGIKAVQKLGSENNFSVETTKDSTYFTDENLKKYDAIIFLNTQVAIC
jgi:hypothetical protein